MPRRRAAADQRVRSGARHRHQRQHRAPPAADAWRGAAISSSARRRATTRWARACWNSAAPMPATRTSCAQRCRIWRRCATRWHETIHLGILNEGDVVEICNASGGQAVSVSLRRGRRDPAHCTAIGKVLLAALPEADLDRFFERGRLVRATPRVAHQPRAADEGDRTRARATAMRWTTASWRTSCAASACRSSAPRAARSPASPSPCPGCASSRSASPMGQQLNDTSRRIAAALGPSHGRRFSAIRFVQIVASGLHPRAQSGIAAEAAAGSRVKPEDDILVLLLASPDADHLSCSGSSSAA